MVRVADNKADWQTNQDFLIFSGDAAALVVVVAMLRLDLTASVPMAVGRCSVHLVVGPEAERHTRDLGRMAGVRGLGRCMLAFLGQGQTVTGRTARPWHVCHSARVGAVGVAHTQALVAMAAPAIMAVGEGVEEVVLLSSALELVAMVVMAVMGT